MTFAQSLKLPFQAHKTKLVSKLCPLCVHTNSEGNWGDHNLTFALNETKAPSARRFIEVTTVAKRTFSAACKPSGYRSWLSLLPLRLIPLARVFRFSWADWQSIQSRTPGIALRRASGIGAPHSSHFVALSPTVSWLRARSISSSTLASICS